VKSKVLFWVILIIILLYGLIYFKKSPSPLTFPQPSSISQTSVFITSPQSNERIKSPVSITGLVEPGWMFEGIFPIKMLDENRNLIVQGLAKEKNPGSWQSGNQVEFIATLNFTTTTDSGFIVFENDNPSGDPELSKTFEIQVNFK